MPSPLLLASVSLASVDFVELSAVAVSDVGARPEQAPNTNINVIKSKIARYRLMNDVEIIDQCLSELE
jgi:hypothetical protein